MISSIKGLFFDNLGTKVMAMILALICWYYIYVTRTASETLIVPFVIETPAQVISRAEKDGEVIREIKVLVEYPKGVSSDIVDGLICRHKIKTSIEQLDKPQSISVELTSADFNTKPGVSIKDILPDNPDKKIQVVLMREIVKPMKVKTEGAIKGSPQKGYRVVAITAEPDGVSVRGPKNILDKYNEIITSKVDITNANTSLSREVRIEPLENVVLSAEERIIMKVFIEEDIIEDVRTVKINLLIPPDFPHFPIQIKPQEKALKFKGPASKIKELKPGHINLFVNIGELCPNPSEVKPPMTFSPKLELRFTSDEFNDIKLAEPLEQIQLEILPLPQPAPPESTPPEKTPEKPPEQPPAPPK